MLAELIREHARFRPDAACIIFEGETTSYAGFVARIDRVAAALRRRGLVAGDRVALVARNHPAFYELALGCAAAGVILVPLNWRLAPREIAAILADAEPMLVIVDSELRELVAGAESGTEVMELADYAGWFDAEPAERAAPVDPDAVALILYTSGTTGTPKGAMLTNRNHAYTARLAREVWGMGAEAVNLVAMPLFHIGGIGYGMLALAAGGTTVVMSGAAPDAVLDAIARHGVTHAFFVPSVIHTLTDAALARGLSLPSLACIAYGAAPIGEALLRRAMTAFGCGFMHTYGMTETAGTVVSLAPRDHDPDGPHAGRLRACGQPVPWIELGVVDPATGDPKPAGEVGEIRIRSPMVMAGYWRRPDATTEAIDADGWLRTGDAAHRDADGYVYIVDRFKDMLVSGGENVYPAEVEGVLSGHPAVAEVAVIGVPHERWGETPKAFAVLRPDALVSERELIDFARARLAHYKCPTSVEFVAALPKSATGKILKREIRAGRGIERRQA